MNVVILSGRLTADPEIRSNGKQIARFTLAVERKKDEADFIRCVCFDRQAENAEKYLNKGTKIMVRGRIQIDSYTDREGRKANSTEIIVNEWEFCESRSNAQKGAQNAPKKSDEQVPNEGFESYSDGFEIPFK